MSLIVPVQAKLLAGEAILLQRTSHVVHILIDIQCDIQAVCCTVGLLLCSCLQCTSRAVYCDKSRTVYQPSCLHIYQPSCFLKVSLVQCTSQAICAEVSSLLFTNRAVCGQVSPALCTRQDVCTELGLLQNTNQLVCSE
jgi:hypothetical protein